MHIFKNNKGQSATEYMLIIAIIVLGLVAGATTLLPRFKDGVKSLSDNVTKTLETTYDLSTPD